MANLPYGSIPQIAHSPIAEKADGIENANFILRQVVAQSLLALNNSSQSGPQFRCEPCGFKGAEVDARRALGHYG
jgi:hypothetical protein